MALENLRCPQFVDFTNRATFDIHDGADIYFEKGIVGELGLGFDDDGNNPDDDGIDELIAALNDATNLQTKNPNDKKDSGISEALSISPNQMNLNKLEQQKVEQTTSAAAAALDTQATSAAVDTNKNKTSTTQVKGNTPVRKRTTSNCSNTSVNSNNSKLKNSKQNQQQPQTNKNIVKKTIAKMTAAFKTTKLDSNQFKLKTKLANQNRDKKKQENNGPLKVEYKQETPTNEQNEILDHQDTSISSSTNRRCSSVPRTLKEKQAASKQITLGHDEKSKLKNIQDNEDEHKQTNEKKPVQQQHHRSRVHTLTDDDNKVAKGANVSVNKAKPANGTAIHRQNTLTEPKSPNFSSKPRQRSCDRKDMPMLPYQGVKFIPKLSHKYTTIEPFSNLEERAKQIASKKDGKKLQEIETNKPMLALNDTNIKKPIIVTSTTQLTRAINLNTSLNKHNKENSICTTTIEIEKTIEIRAMNTTSNANDSVLSNKAANLSTMSNSSRKRVDLKPMQLHTEQRAQKRQQYDQYLKDRERMAELIKKNLEMQKMIESKNEIQKLRSQQLFKSKPFKQVKPMEIKPSDKPLTEPKSPQLGFYSTTTATTSTSKLNLVNTSGNSNNNSKTRSLSQENLRLT